jgi:tRNA(fMet)-specific endonuclease VapC
LRLLLDTNVASGIIRARRPQFHKHLAQAVVKRAEIFISAIVAHELWFGVARSDNPMRRAERVRLFLDRWEEPVPFTGEDAEIAGDLREKLSERGEMIGPYDLLIAAQALRLDATLVTANVREFARVPDLKWEDWSQSLTNP